MNKELIRTKRKVFNKWNAKILEEKEEASIPTGRSEWLTLVESKAFPKAEEEPIKEEGVV